MSQDEELMGLYWTVSGPVEVHVGREWSLFDFADRCAQAARVGYAGLGIWHADLEHVLEDRSLADVRAIMEANGLHRLELEFLMDWFLEPGHPDREASDAIRGQLFEAAGALGAHHIKVGNIPGTACEADLLAQRFAELCAEAAEHTDAAVVYEFMPFDVNVQSVEAARGLLDAAGAPNGGLAVDTWHMSKLGIRPDELHALDSHHLRWVELSDGMVEDMPDPVEETTQHRRLPGEGEFDIPGYIEACRTVGYDGPWGVEVLSAELRALPIEEIFDRSYAATSAQFSAPAGAA